MRILLVCPTFAKNEKDNALGGMSFAIYKLATGLQNRNHSVCVLNVGNHFRRWIYKGIQVVTIENYENGLSTGFFDTLRNTLIRETEIEDTIRLLDLENKIDIIQYVGWFGVGLLHNRRKPAVMRISSYTSAQLPEEFSKGKTRALSMMERIAILKMDAVYAPSKAMANAIEEDVHRGVEVIETPFIPETIELDDSLYNSVLNNKKYLLYFGRMMKDKGICIIAETIRNVLSQYSNLHYVFAGTSGMIDGKRSEEIILEEADGFENRVVFLGEIPKEKLLPVIDNAEAILMPSIADNLPNGCLEAMSRGKIVVGTDGSSLEQFISDEIDGFLATIGDATSLEKCIFHVLGMEEHEKEVIQKNACRRVDDFNLNSFAEKVEKLYSKSIKNKKD